MGRLALVGTFHAKGQQVGMLTMLADTAMSTVRMPAAMARMASQIELVVGLVMRVSKR